METETQYSLGWHRELPDARDWQITEHEAGQRLMARGIPVLGSSTPIEPPQAIEQVDLREHCSPIEDQLAVGSCTSQAAVGLIEYLERRALGNHINASRLFVYKVTRNLLGWTGDTGAYLRDTLKALKFFGVCPEKYWPYDVSKFDQEPSAFCYAMAQRARALKYFRLDGGGMDGDRLLALIKQVTSSGLPVVFGYTVFNYGNDQGEIALPEPNQEMKGGHAVMCVGYDDHRDINGRKGALRIRNSWGTKWGEQGYGWLPYAYVQQGLTADWWTIFAQDYLGD